MSKLTAELLRVHDTLARRANMSSVTVAQHAMVEKPLLDSIAAALLTLGGLHGPIVQAYELLSEWIVCDSVEAMLDQGKLVPGWGSGFVKAARDTEFNTLDDMLFADHKTMWNRIASVTRYLHSKDKILSPNAACYTAAVAIVTGVPASLSPSLFLRGRIDAWVQIYAENYKPRL
jgi:citrate synthase